MGQKPEILRDLALGFAITFLRVAVNSQMIIEMHKNTEYNRKEAKEKLRNREIIYCRYISIRSISPLERLNGVSSYSKCFSFAWVAVVVVIKTIKH